MFRLVHVSVVRPPLMARSRSSRWGRSSGLATGRAPSRMRVYSLITWASWPCTRLNLSSCSSTILAGSGTSTPMASKQRVSRSSWATSRSKLTRRAPVSGCRTSSVAFSPCRAASTDLTQARCQRASNSTSAAATRLYVFTMRLYSLVATIAGLAANLRIGSSMRRSSWRDQAMLPATGGALRARGGECLCFSYAFCTASRSSP